MIPARIDPGTRSQGERDAFIRLRDDPTTKDWVVLHSLDVADPGHQLAAEIDFVVLIPGLGVLCLEMKATSRLRREAGVWYYGRDPHGDSAGPFRQAASAMHALRQKVATSVPTLGEVVFWSAVVFPLLHFDISSHEWNSWQVIDRRGYVADFSGACRRVLLAAHDYLMSVPTAGWYSPTPPRPTAAEVDTLVRILRPEFEVFQSMRSRAGIREDELKRYTEDQFQALDAMDVNSRVLFEGPAGTGKTLLALEATRRSVVAGRRTALLCFNRLLGSELAAQTPAKTAHVTTLHGLMLKVTGGPRNADDFERGAFWDTELPNLAIDALLNDPTYPQFEELVVDEAQDIMQPIYLDFLDLCLEGGLRTGRWRLFGDFEAQALYGAPAPALTELVTARSSEVTRYRLRINCRNVPRIASLGSMLAGLTPPYSRVLRPDSGVEPRVLYFQNSDDQLRQLGEVISALRAEGYRPKEIVILSPRASGYCAEGLTSPPATPLSPANLGHRAGLMSCTVHSFKGLEAPCIVLTDIDHVSGDRAQALFYTAVTRALDRLVVLASSTCRKEIVQRLITAPPEVDRAR